MQSATHAISKHETKQQDKKKQEILKKHESLNLIFH